MVTGLTVADADDERDAEGNVEGDGMVCRQERRLEIWYPEGLKGRRIPVLHSSRDLLSVESTGGRGRSPHNVYLS